MSILDGEDFGAYLTRHREILGLTQHDLAQLLDVSQAAVGQWERGTTFPRSSKLPALAEALGASHVELVTLRHVAVTKNLPNRRVPQIASVEEHSALSLKRSAISEVRPEQLTGLGLLSRIVVALEKGLLQPHQISMLGSLLQTFQRDSSAMQIALSEGH